MSSRVRSVLSLLRVRKFALTSARCPFCGPTLIVKLRDDEVGVRCIRCGASAVHLSIGFALAARVESLDRLDAYELSARGPLVDFLRRNCRSLAVSEYFADVSPGSMRDGVRCEDVQRLTFADTSFDLITHTEVMEHVPDDSRAFRELHRVLRPNGWLVFTVPLTDHDATVERARLRDGTIEHVLPPMFHTDPLRGGDSILVFRDYGADVAQRLSAAGFSDIEIVPASPEIPWRMGRRVIVARRK
jgi:SAM-dependent methyltransferase